ncbi:hypothetical protein D6779_02550, partial [Candidatus Parcubacteria bacterium]
MTGVIRWSLMLLLAVLLIGCLSQRMPPPQTPDLHPIPSGLPQPGALENFTAHMVASQATVQAAQATAIWFAGQATAT